VATELNIFDVATATPTDSWAYGSAAAKAWFTVCISLVTMRTGHQPPKNRNLPYILSAR
jgi:hypothetical protein